MIDEAMIADLKAEGLTEDSLKKVEPLKGKKFEPEGVWAALRPILHADPVVSKKLKEIDDRIRATGRPAPKLVVDGAIEGYSAQGYRGQFLVVLPAAESSRSASFDRRTPIRSRQTISASLRGWSRIWYRPPPYRRRVATVVRSSARPVACQRKSLVHRGRRKDADKGG